MNCTAQSLDDLAPRSLDITIESNETLHLVSPKKFIFLGSDFDYAYEGLSSGGC